MDQEWIVSGYCRTQDQARTVMAEYYNSQWDFACDFPDCAYAKDCPVAAELRDRMAKV